MGRSREKWEALCAEIDARHVPAPVLPQRPPLDRTAIVLGRNHETQAPILLGERARLEHAHVIGTTGGGKSRALEFCIRQDIKRGRGVCVVDPHGNHPESLYASLLGWLDSQGYTRGGSNERTIHLIDPNAPTHTAGFNPLALPTPKTDVAVVARLRSRHSNASGGTKIRKQNPR